MPELEIHHEGAEADPTGKRMGVMAATIAVLLAVVTILSHRSHTDAVVLKTEANDQWAFYQAKSIKSHTLGVAQDLVTALGTKADANQGLLKRYQEERKRYDTEGGEIKHEAQMLTESCKRMERQALRYDLGEGSSKSDWCFRPCTSSRAGRCFRSPVSWPPWGVPAWP